MEIGNNQSNNVQWHRLLHRNKKLLCLISLISVNKIMLNKLQIGSRSHRHKTRFKHYDLPLFLNKCGQLVGLTILPTSTCGPSQPVTEECL